MPLPRLILTSGEPAGIGPDLCLAAASQRWPCELIVAGDRDLLAQRARRLGANIRFIDHAGGPRTSGHIADTLRVLHRPLAVPACAGRLDTANAGYVIQLLDAAIDGCSRGEFDAIVTAPVQKSVIKDAGMAFCGHTEYLAERTGGSHPVMMLVSGRLRVALATTHLPLSAVSRAVTVTLLERVLFILDQDLRDRFALPTPRILVCGLNPHAGESGHLGREEIEIIVPVLERLRGRGMRLTGPAPADTAFTPHMLADTDAVLAMYHDQGLPVIKYAGFDSAVNVTLGLPIIRTSVDHGTALDLAGTGKANSGSMNAAIGMAIDMANRRISRRPAAD